MSLSHCQKCGSQLVDGPDVERRSNARGFSITISNIPTKICPRGCTGIYWYWADFGTEVMDCLACPSSNIAKRKLSLWKTRHFCRNCSVELSDMGRRSDFSFHAKLRIGTEVTMSINASSLTCPQCGSSYMPAQQSSNDPYYRTLADTIGEALTKDLICR